MTRAFLEGPSVGRRLANIWKALYYDSRSADDAISRILAYMRQCAPDVLRDLRDHEDVAGWAQRHRLHSDAFIRRAEHLRQYWCARPRDAERIRWRWFVVMDEEVDIDPGERWRQHLEAHGWLVPQHDESSAQWIARARRLYSGWRQARNVSRDHFQMHCEWFTTLQLDRASSPGSIASAAGVDPSAVNKATQRIAALIGVRRRRFRAGPRPKAQQKL